MKVLTRDEFWARVMIEPLASSDGCSITAIVKIGEWKQEYCSFYNKALRNGKTLKNDFLRDHYYNHYIADCIKYKRSGAKHFIEQQYQNYKPTKKPSYSFTVQKPEDFDYMRICREVEEDNPKAVGFILTMPTTKTAVVTLYASFLRQFHTWNKVFVDYKRLYEYWGIKGIITVKDFVSAESEFDATERAATTNFPIRNIIVWKKDLPKIRKEIEFAIKFLETKSKKTSVTVEPIIGG